MPTPARLRDYVAAMTRLVEAHGSDEPTMLRKGREFLGDLISRDDWLDERFARPDPARYQQYLLYCDPLERFSVVSFVWGPGQRTPVHDHCVWGLVGVMRGSELCEEYRREGAGLPMRKTAEHLVEPGGIDAVSPTIGDIHVVSNALQDRASISIHVYGGNIGAVRRHVYVPETSEIRDFVSGYSSDVVPNLWDRSRESAAR